MADPREQYLTPEEIEAIDADYSDAELESIREDRIPKFIRVLCLLRSLLIPLWWYRLWSKPDTTEYNEDGEIV